VHGPHEYVDLGSFELASGFVLPEARLAYKTMGTLSAAKDNAILLPHMYTGTAAFNLREQDTAAIDAIYADVLAE
jgi:homoserine O-acetyltransferase